MEKYKKLHQWMIIPFLVVQIGIFNYYWPKFTSQTWEIHIHYWLVTLWYLLMIIQPYLIQQGKMTNHRTLGIIGFLIAGGVLFTGISILDIPLKLIATYEPGKPGPPIVFYYGTLVVEFLLIIAFAYAVVKSILNRHNLFEHSWWLIASVYYMMGPALGRGMIVFWASVLPPDKFNPMIVFITTEIVYLILFLPYVFKFGKLKHPATILGLVLVIVRFLRIPIGNIKAVQEFLEAVIKW